MTKTIIVKTKADFDCVNITPQVEEFVQESKVEKGSVLVFSKGSTGAVTTIEFKEGVIKDLEEALEKIAPKNGKYHHEHDWGDYNGFSHIRAALMKPSIVVPFSVETNCNTSLQLGTWQQIVLLNFDNRDREREVVLRLL
jgi:secondary thiamine-phosphate synthase enzyme